MASKTVGWWGIDVGQCALKAVRLEVRDGRPFATAYDYIEHPKILSQPDADPDALVRESLDKFLSRNAMGRDRVAAGVSGQAGQGALVRFVKLPPVEARKVPEIVKFEARQQIPFPLDEVVWDYQAVGGGEAVGGFAMETEVGLFAVKREVVGRLLGQFGAAGAEVHLVQMAPLALCNYATYELLGQGGPDPVAADDVPDGKRRCAVVLDVGAEGAQLVITDGGRIIWQRAVPVGGNHFTKILTKEMRLTFAKAEHLKRNAAKSPEFAAILKAMRPVLTEFVGEVQRSLGYFTNTHRDAHVAFLVGLGNAFKLPGLQKYLGEKLSLEVRRPARVDRVGGDGVLADPGFTDNLLTFPVAVGLALQGLGLARLDTTLLPAEVRRARLVRAKKPWAAAAAACLAAGGGVVGFGRGAQLAGVRDPAIAKAAESAASAVKAASAQAAEAKVKADATAAALAEVQALATGGEHRTSWARLYEVLTAALPRPPHPSGKDPGNLNAPEQQVFWRNDDGKLATRRYWERLAQGIPLEKLLDDDNADYLAVVNVEAVYPRWVEAEAVAGFYAAAEEQLKKDARLSMADDLKPEEREEVEPEPPLKKYFTAKPPESAGWLVEVRGYTYHAQGTNFLRKGLIANLRDWDRFAEATRDKDKDNPPADGDEAAAEPPPDPVTGTVSHAVLLAVVEDKDPKDAPLKLASGRVDQLLAAAAGGPPAGPALVPAWSSPTSDKVLPARGPKPKPRYEFIACFFWRDPAPPAGVPVSE